MSEQKKHDHQHEQHNEHNDSPQKQHVGAQDPHHLKESLPAQTPGHQPLDEGAPRGNVGQNEGTGRPPLMKK